jgi:hypothetical protein
MRFYTDPAREADSYSLPDAEVFYINKTERRIHAGYDNDPGEPGWYYWYCFPGCLPDSDPIGPFANEAEAIVDARENA